jgi:hypothetical protein
MAPAEAAPPVQARVSGAAVRSQGILIVVNSKKFSFSISGSGRTALSEFHVTSETTLYADSERIAFSRLQEYVGRPISVWFTQVDTGQVAGRVMILPAAVIRRN